MVERPPAVAGEFACLLPRHRKSASAARKLLREFLADMADGGLYAHAGELLLSELVANAVRHARVSPGRMILVRFELSRGALRIEVHDAGAGRPVVRAVGVDEEGGRGLWLVDQLSVRWGCCPRAGGVGKATWAIIGPAARDDRSRDGGEPGGCAW